MHKGYRRSIFLLLIAAALVVGGVVFDMAWVSFPEWARWLISVVAVLAFSVAVLQGNVAWESGRAARKRNALVEQRLAVVGHFVWFAGSLLGTVGLVGTAFSGESRISVLLAAFGIIALSISGGLGGWPSIQKGLGPLLLSKRIMNWQLAVSVAIAVPLLGKSVGTDQGLFQAVGTNWGFPALVAVGWILAAGTGTMLYEPLKYRLEE